MNNMNIREMVIADHCHVLALMKATPGVIVRTADSLESTRRYLDRNPGLSFVAEQDATLVGIAMAGHDGRRGYLQHVIVAPSYRGRDLARTLVARCIAALHAQKIQKVHLDVLADNTPALSFWQHLGWSRRDDIARFSFTTVEDENA